MEDEHDLWKSDGTPEGTTLVKDLNPDLPHSDIDQIAIMDGMLYLVGDHGYFEGTALWKSDGTEAGTVLVKEDWPTGLSSAPSDFGSLNGKLFFSAADSADPHGIGLNRELWMSDGSEAGTVLVKDIGLGRSSSPTSLTTAGGSLVLPHGQEPVRLDLWKSDGTPAGTVHLRNFRNFQAELEGSPPPELTDVNGTLFLSRR